jgi:hypothetical protein
MSPARLLETAVAMRSLQSDYELIPATPLATSAVVRVELQPESVERTSCFCSGSTMLAHSVEALLG